jgi:hypothetical protein
VSENARGYYRVEYPLRERPLMDIDGAMHQVIDCSESGLRFELGRGAPPDPGAMLHGIVRFSNGLEVSIRGTVVRVQDGAVAVQFAGKGIPMGIIMREQLDLLARYPMHLRSRRDPQV